MSGVLLGLAAAICQSISYLFSRLFVTRRHRGAIRLLVLGHAAMGAASLAAVPMLFSPHTPSLDRYILPLLGTSGFYLLGQLGLFLALHSSDASRVSPLLGLKVMMLAFFTVLVLHQHLAGAQWAAVTLSVAAAVLLSYSGGRLHGRAMLALLLACVFYCGSDLSIRVLVDRLAVLGPVRSVLWAVACSYVLSGGMGLALMPWAGRGAMRDLPYAIPWAASWLAAMVFLYACFASIGVVFGNIVQATRGPLSVLLGAQLARLGLEHLELRTTRGVFIRRLAAASLMFLAIALFFLGK